MSRFVVIGAGIVGLATAAALAQRGDEVVVIEKEPGVSRHQTGRNSGVIHSGLYYVPGSLKATMAVAGAKSMRDYAKEKGVAVEITGKLVVATADSQRAGLHKLAARADANGVPARLVSRAEAADYEPHVSCVEALRVESTGIVDYKGISQAMADDIEEAGGELRFGESFVSATTRGSVVHIETDRGSLTADMLINCGGLHSDRIAAASGVEPSARIVPFRGEYYELVEEKQSLVKGLIYPVPDPNFPFLGVHLTKMIDGSVHAGPNAVLAFAREGYDWGTVNVKDVVNWALYPGMWRMGAKNIVPGANEMLRSLSPRRFAASLAELVPGITKDDIVKAPAGVRAQALTRDGKLADDFLIQMGPRQVHVLNAPSPAATGSLEIAKYIVTQIDGALV